MSPSASLSFKGQATKQATVKWFNWTFNAFLQQMLRLSVVEIALCGKCINILPLFTKVPKNNNNR